MTEPPKKRGRPRAFDPSLALDRATDTFLRFGYAGASLEALTTAMGVNKPSLYATFGDKRRLFFRALEELATKIGRRCRLAFERGDSLESSLREMFLEAVDIYSSSDAPAGCLVVSGSATEAIVDEGMAQFSRELFALCDKVMAKWMVPYVREGSAVSAMVLSQLCNGVIHDISLRARIGESKVKLREHARGAAVALARSVT